HSGTVKILPPNIPPANRKRPHLWFSPFLWQLDSGCLTEGPLHMDRLLLQLQRKKDRRRLEDWLAKSYRIVLPDPEQPLEEQFDLALIDGPSLKQFAWKVRARKKAEEPVFLPFLLLTVKRRGSIPARHLGRLVDDVIVRPLNEKEVRARVANMMRMRHWSLDLKK